FFYGYSHYAVLADLWDRLTRIPFGLRVGLSAVMKTLDLIPNRAFEPLLAEVCRRFFSVLEPADLRDKVLKLSHVLAAPGFPQAYDSALQIWPKEELRQ